MNAWPRCGVLLAFLCSALLSPAQEADLPGPAGIVRWGNPLDGGRVRILLLAPRGAMRDAEELATRYECEIARIALPKRALTAPKAEVTDATDAGTPGAAAPPLQPGEPAAPEASPWMDELRAALAKNPGVIVVGNVEIPTLPNDIQELIAASARSGAGLVMANVLLDGGPLDTFLGELTPAEATKSITAGAAPAPLQGDKPLANYVHALEGENMRAVLLDFPGDPPLTHALLPPPPDGVYLETSWRENAWSLVLRAIHWSARKTGESVITSMTDTSPQGPNEEEIPPDLPQEFVQSMRDSAFNLPLHTITTALSAPAPHALEATFQLRRAGEARRAYTTVTRVAKGASTFSTQLLINTGEFEVDCILAGRKGTVDWWTLPVSVPGWPQAEDVRADKTYLLPNDSLAINARVRPIFGASRAGAIYVRALAPDGALLGEAIDPVDSNGGTAQLKMSFADLLAPMVVVEIYGFEGQARRYASVELASTSAQILRFPVRQLRRAPRFEIVVQAPARDEYNARWYLEQWRAHGAGTVYTSGGNTAVVRAAELGLALLPEVARIAPETRDDENKPCLSDTAFLAREQARLKEELLLYWAGGGGAYGLGWPAYLANPGDAANPCQSDSCIDGFRAWLAKHYGDVTSLNAAWGSQWPDFDDVPPPTLADCRQANAPAPWIAWRGYQDETFAAALASAHGAVQGVDPAGLTGFATLSDDDVRRGYDWARLAAATGFTVVPATQDSLEKVRAYRTQSIWGGLSAPVPASEAEGRWLAWHALLQQAPGVWLDGAAPSALDAGDTAYFAGDGTLTAPGGALSEAVRQIQESAGPLLLAASRAPSGIAVLDSRASRFACDVDTQFGPYLDAQTVWTALLRREGFDFTYITPAQAARGGLAPYRALILPLALALAPEEAAAIAEFAQQGGALLADIAPGTYTALGARAAAPMLDEWFGVRHEGPPRAVEAAVDGLKTFADAAVRAEAAEVKRPGEIPLQFVVAREKHNALLLNHVPVAGMSVTDTAVREFLKANACLQAVELGGDARGAMHITRARFRFGQAEIFALLAAPGAPEKLDARVVLPEGAQVFDITAGLPVERPKKITLRLRPGEGKVLSLLPYEVSELTVEAPGIVQQGKRLNLACQVRARKAEPGAHLIRFTLSSPVSGVIAQYTQWVTAERGMGTGYIPIALGQVPGFYQLRAEDLLSGVFAERDVKIVGLSVQ
jgi:hypothetical protein